MPTYNVYLAALGNHGLSGAEQTSIQTSLQAWFGQIATGTSYGTATVAWTATAPTGIQNHELLIYFVSDVTDSVLVAMPGRSGNMATGDGFTAWVGSLTASEVYVGASRQYLPQIAFHEAMHNKLQVGEPLHDGNGLAHIPVSPGTSPSAQNVTQMRAALAANHPQWTGGWTVLNDPLRGL